MKPIKWIVLLLSVLPVLAIGPKIPHLLYWTPATPVPADNIETGYWVYWRTPAGLYDDARRVAVSTNQPYDLSVLGLPKGVYWLAMSSTNLEGGESGVDHQTLWRYLNPNQPDVVLIKP